MPQHCQQAVTQRESLRASSLVQSHVRVAQVWRREMWVVDENLCVVLCRAGSLPYCLAQFSATNPVRTKSKR